MFLVNSRLKRNIFSSISSQSLKIFIQIFYPPLMIFFWGIENFGIWIFLISIPNIIQIFNFNLTDASVNQMAIYNAQKKHKNQMKFFKILYYLYFKYYYSFFNFLIFFFLKNLAFLS